MSRYIEYQECEVEIGGKKVLAQSAAISINANIEANRAYGGDFRYGQHYSASSVETATLDLEYYIVDAGKDHIEQFTGQKYADGKFCGIEFSGAGLTSYSVSMKPFEVVKYKATFTIYSGYDQRSNGAEGVADPSIGRDEFYEKFANGAYSELINFNKENIGLDFPSSIDYSVSCQRVPKYIIGDRYPRSVALSKVERKMSIAGENIGSIISFSGKDFATVKLSPKNIDKAARGQDVTCNGIITSQSLSVSAEGVLAGTIGIYESLR
jgi:hypothetical protein